MNELSLFTGAGGGVLGTKLLRFRTIGYVEWDDYCQRILAQRIRDGIFENAPIFGDIRTFISDGYAASYTGLVDVLTAGFPCQPFSVAGKQRGAADERNMWPATADVIRIVQPRYVLLENVPGIRSYLPVVIRDLRRCGYDVQRPLILGADDVGAPHRRKRVWIMAYSVSNGRRSWGTQCAGQQWGAASVGASSVADPKRGGCGTTGECGQLGRISQWGANNAVSAEKSSAVADAKGQRCGEAWQNCERHTEWFASSGPSLADSGIKQWNGGLHWFSGWEREPLETLRDARERGREKDGLPVPESLLGRVADGVADRVDRLKALGNGQVPQVVATAWQLLVQETGIGV